MNLTLKVAADTFPFLIVPKCVADVNGWKDGDMLDLRTGPFVMTDRGDVVVRSLRVHISYETAKAKRRKTMAKSKGRPR